MRRWTYVADRQTDRQVLKLTEQEVGGGGRHNREFSLDRNKRRRRNCLSGQPTPFLATRA
jgi:hypothetical protein